MQSPLGFRLPTPTGGGRGASFMYKLITTQHTLMQREELPCREDGEEEEEDLLDCIEVRVKQLLQRQK